MTKRCKKQSKLRVAWLVAGLILLLTACMPERPAAEPRMEDGAPQKSTETPISEAAATHVSTGEPAEEVAINALTGQVAMDQERLTRRPILIKVTLFPRNNRPQWGLSQADLVFEHYTEGGLSRFSALFYGNEAGRVGPIRSARLVDIQLVRMYGALFAYGSADQRVLKQIDSTEFAERAVREFPAGCPPLCRIDPTVQNHLVTDTRALQEFYAGRGVDLAAPGLGGMSFDETTPEGGASGVRLEISYSADDFHQWRYEPRAGAYTRFQESGEGPGQVLPLRDQTTGAQIEADNVVLLKVPHELYSHTPEIVDIQLYGEGQGMAFRDGLAYQVGWIRPFPAGVLYLTYPDGSAYPLKPGVTWFELVGTTSEVVQPSEQVWQVTFSTP